MSKFIDLYNKIVMEQLEGVDPMASAEDEYETSEQVSVSIKEKIEAVIVDEIEDLSESLWRDKLPQIEQYIIDNLTGVGDPNTQINNMDYLDFVNMVINALKDLGIME